MRARIESPAPRVAPPAGSWIETVSSATDHNAITDAVVAAEEDGQRADSVRGELFKRITDLGGDVVDQIDYVLEFNQDDLVELLGEYGAMPAIKPVRAGVRIMDQETVAIVRSRRSEGGAHATETR